MLTALLIIGIANLLLGLYLLGCLNNGFKFTNVKIDSYAASQNLVIDSADKVVGAQKKQMKALIDEVRN